MKNNNKHMPKILIAFIFLIIFLPLGPARGAMNDYCAIPPFLAQSIPPNVLILLDNSGSMCDQAYAGDYDPTSFTTGQYYGYFDGSKNYKYTGNNRWEETADAMSTGTVANPIASGSFLNWATMRRIEVAKRLMVGGKGNPRSPSPGVTVKLDGETGCADSWDFDKTFDTSAGNLIYPFVGEYRFTREDGDNLNISPISGGTDTFYTRPNSDITGLPSGWTEYPVVGAPIAWTKVDETPSDEDTTYIQNANTTDPVIMGFTYADSEPGGTISVTVRIRAKQTAGGQTRRIRAVLRMDSADYESNYSNIDTTYRNYSFTWANNPVTGAAWTWDQIKNIAASGNLQGFGVKAANNYNSRYPRITQVYLVVTVTVPTGGPYNTIIDWGNTPARGIIDTLGGDVRFGLAYYANSSDGGRIENYVGFDTPINMITSIENLVPSTWTPLGETLYELTRYFRQDEPYYGNTPADYSRGSVQIVYDPYWYKYTDLSASLTDQYVPCAKSFVLFLTDGESTQDLNVPAGSIATPCALDDITACSGYGGSPHNPNPRFAGTTIGTTYASNGRDYMIDVAYWGRTNDMRPGACTTVPTSWQQCLPGNQNLVLYSVFMFGTGSTLLKDAAIYGGFNDLNNNNLLDCDTLAAECYRDSDGDGTVESNGDDFPLTYYEGDDGYALEVSITNAISAILKRASAGTAASVLASGEGSGANIVQAIFYPKRTFVTTEIDWTATIQNLWYFIDERLNISSIREDTDQERELELEKDNIVHFSFDIAEMKTKASLYASDASGNQGALINTINIEDLKYLWEAGGLLHSRNTGTDPRTIYVTTNGTSLLSGNFTTGNAGTLQPFLQAADVTEAQNIISYIRGDSDVDTALYRSRTVTNAGTTAIWRLGDIVSSTPRISSSIPLVKYNEKYGDLTYAEFIKTSTYTNRGMVFTGSNDGMLHAFKLGSLQMVKDGSSKKAILSGTNLGHEEWAFIPKGVLPYLKHLMDKNYCHLYYIDATPYIFDASIGAPGSGDISDVAKAADGSSWRTILIGGMRLGGACKDTTYAGNYGVNIPIAGNGYSSYFAIDITDQSDPKLLWEFTDANLGFTTSGPAVVRINARTVSGTNSNADDAKNGKWFVIFASGPTGPIDKVAHQFMGYSDQNLRLFILDLKTGSLMRTINTGIQNAFGGSMNNSTVDYDLDYQDDAVYIGYTNSEDSSPDADTRWTQGGVIRLITREDLAGSNTSSGGDTALNPGNWSWTYVAKDIGSVTSSIANLAHHREGQKIADKAYVFFGSGRYFYKTSEVDNGTVQRTLFGVAEPCLEKLMKPITGMADPICTDAADMVDDGSHSLISNATADKVNDPEGWYINMDPAVGTNSAERNITDPLATSIGAVFFTTYMPSSDICAYGGVTYIWGLRYDTGGTVNDLLQGIALLQVSTGSIEEINLKTAFVEKQAGGRAGEGRRTGEMTGAPPIGQGLSVVTNPTPKKRTIHKKER